jgi:tetratricopeptide (TPR) repeat protein
MSEVVQFNCQEEAQILLQEFSPVSEVQSKSPSDNPFDWKKKLSHWLYKNRFWLSFFSFGFAYLVFTSRIKVDWIDVPILLGVLLFHDIGHIVSMKLLEYSNHDVLFIPAFRAIAINSKKQASLTEKVFVSLAGPLPGLMIGVPLLVWLGYNGFLDIPANPDWRVKLAQFLVGFNLLFLLPIYASGIQILDALIVSRLSRFETSIQVVFCLLFGVIAWSATSWLWYLFAVIGLLLVTLRSEQVEIKKILLKKRTFQSSLGLKAYTQVLLQIIYSTFPDQERDERLTIARKILQANTSWEAPRRTRWSLIAIYSISLVGTILGMLESQAPGYTRNLPYQVHVAFWLKVKGPNTIIQETDILLNAGQDSHQLRMLSSSAHAYKGDIYKRNGNLNLAESEYNKAIELSPNDVFLVEKRKDLYWHDLTLDRTDTVPIASNIFLRKTIQDTDRLIELQPGKLEHYLNRCTYKYFQNNYQSALADCNYFVSRAPNSEKGYSERAGLYIQLDDNSKALEDYNRVIQLAPHQYQGYEDRAILLLYTMMRYQEALSDINKAIELESQKPVLYRHRANIWLALGETKKAEEDDARYEEMERSQKR